MEKGENVFERLINDDVFDELNNMVRWNGLNRNKDETVAHHSYIVTLFSRVLADHIFEPHQISEKLQMVTYAVFHDFDEIFTGDVKHGVKYNEFNGSELRSNLDDLVEFNIYKHFSSDSAFDSLFRSSILDVDKFIKAMVKVCDWLSMCFYLKKEIELGSKRVERKYIDTIEKLKAHCRNCLSTYSGGRDCIRVQGMDEILNDIININWKYDGVDD